MKKVLIFILLMTLFALPVMAQESLPSDQDKLSYAIGMNIGLSMKKQSVDVDSEQLSAGLLAALEGRELLLSEQEMIQILTAYQQEMQMKMLAEAAAAAEKNLKEAETYLQQNAAKEGVVTLPSGLQYKVLTAGQGAVPTAESKVEVHYRGTLADGTEFDSSYQRGEPASFPVGGVIPGWTEALQLMKEGSKWELVIPPALAYAERGAPPVIPPNAALVFEVELLKIVQ